MPKSQIDLPDVYSTVAADVMAFCQPPEGLWVDLGAGTGGLGLALASASRSTVVLVDPNEEALRRGLGEAHGKGLGSRVLAIVGQAEEIPLATASVNLVVSRGSIFFWQDKPRGLREVSRLLPPGGKAMIGGGLGSAYPAWARREFIRWRRHRVERGGPDTRRAFLEARSPESFRRWALEAGLSSFEVAPDGGFPPQEPCMGLGIWLRFTKGIADEKRH